MAHSTALDDGILLLDQRICFVDNEESERQDLKESLKYLGNSPKWVVLDFSEDLIKRAINNEFDIFVCDFKMPDKNGIQVLEEIRHFNKKIILALFTAFAISKDSEEDSRCKKGVIQRFKKIDGVGCLLGTLQNQIPAIRKKLESLPPYEEPKKRNIFLSLFKGNDKTHTVPVQKNNDNTASTDFESVSNLSNTVNIGPSQNEGILDDELKRILMNLAEDLIKDLETSEEQDAYIYHSTAGKITIRELTEHIRQLSPIGVEQLKYWLLAKKRLKRKNNP